MNTRNKIQSALKGFTLGGVRRIFGLVAVAILAFLLGGVLVGNGDGLRSAGSTGHDHAAEASSAPESWTCSMHPQIKLPKPGKCPICYMDLISLESDSEDQLEPRQLRLSETAKELARIQTTPAIRAFAEKQVRLVGKITFDESNVAYITAWAPGRLDRLYADFTGITVNKGDRLVYMYSPELLAAQEELVQAQAAVKSLGITSGSILRSTAEATLEAARDKLALLGLTQDQIQDIETTGRTSDHLMIHSPIGGVVIHKDAKEGMYVSTGARIYTIADLSKLWVTFDAYESDLPWLRYGQRAEFTIPSFPGERFEAVISFIDPFVDPKTRTVRVRAIVSNDDGRIKPDMFVHGLVKSLINRHGDIVDEYLADKWISPMHPEIVKDGPGTCDICGRDLVPAASLGYTRETIEQQDAPLLIPASAPLVTGKRAVVYVEIPNEGGPIFEGREVELGPRAGDFYIAKAGIVEGETIVSNGAFKIDSELQLQAKPSMMSPMGHAVVAGHQHGHSAHAPKKQTDSHKAGEKLEVEMKARQALTPVYDAYFNVQMSLAKDDFKKAKEAGSALSSSVKKVDTSAFSHAGHKRWMELSKKISEHAAKLSSAEDIKTAREDFIKLSGAVIELHDLFGHAAERNYYLTYCPMAQEGAGTYWLQTEDIVWNSIYGKMMLRCGSIQDTLAPAPSMKQQGMTKGH